MTSMDKWEIVMGSNFTMSVNPIGKVFIVWIWKIILCTNWTYFLQILTEYCKAFGKSIKALFVKVTVEWEKERERVVVVVASMGIIMKADHVTMKGQFC